MARGCFSEVEHTADLGLDLSGPDPAAVLEAAQRGLVEALFGETPEVSVTDEIDVDLSEETWPDLLKAWCERLYMLLEEEAFLPLECEVEASAPDDVRARIRGARLGRLELARASELKAVTYHQLAFAPTGSGVWRARVIFDV